MNTAQLSDDLVSALSLAQADVERVAGWLKYRDEPSTMALRIILDIGEELYPGYTKNLTEVFVKNLTNGKTVVFPEGVPGPHRIVEFICWAFNGFVDGAHVSREAFVEYGIDAVIRRDELSPYRSILQAVLVLERNEDRTKDELLVACDAVFAVECMKIGEVIANMMAGKRPIVYLTEAQRQAFAWTDPPPDDMEFPPSPFILPPVVVWQGAQGMVGLYYGVAYDGNGGDDVYGGLYIDRDGYATFLLSQWMPAGHDERLEYLDGLEARGGYRDWANIVISCHRSLAVFPTTSSRPKALEPTDRAAWRREAREIARTGVTITNQFISVRYLDDRGAVATGQHRDTGRHVRPHIRKGHWRNVRYGPIAEGPERPTRPAFVGPVIVNGHLGLDDMKFISYQEKTA